MSRSFRVSLAPEDLSDDAALKACSRQGFLGHECPVLGRVLLIARLGRGAAGVVYLGLNPRLEREVAVKVISPVRLEQWQLARERFLREARLAACIRSPHLVEVFEIDEDPISGCNYIIMEYVHGCSAADWAKRPEIAGSVASEPAVLDIGMAVSLALAAAHCQGIVHRDVKPGNILVPIDSFGTPLTAQAKLTDLGVAKVELDDEGGTESFTAVGTPGYMAPEQIKDAKHVSKAADVFGVGATLYRLLTGEAPFVASSVYDSFTRTLEGDYAPLRLLRPDVSESLERIVDTCLSPDPGDRFPDAVALAAALKSICGQRTEGPQETRLEPLTVLVGRSEVGKSVPRAPPLSLPSKAVEEFREAVDRARRDRDSGTLRLLAQEASALSPCLRFVGRAACSVEDWSTARQAWEGVLESHPKDHESILSLGTVYERLGDLGASTQALSRILEEGAAPPSEVAEARAQVARNRKHQWIDDWRDLPADEQRTAALRSPFLGHALEDYGVSYLEDQNHYYSGLNALATCTIMLDLAHEMPREWSRRFASQSEATRRLDELEAQRKRLVGAVGQSLESAHHRIMRTRTQDVWLAFGFAEHNLLSAPSPDFVAASYGEALATCDEYGSSMPVTAARRQVELYVMLEVRAENARAALGVFDARSLANGLPTEVVPRVVLFTGHRIDDPERATARFPANRATAVGAALRVALASMRETSDRQLLGIAGAASGGDILFHEACAELEIATEALLPFPIEEYVRCSVAPAGAEWILRFQTIVNARSPRILSRSATLPSWILDGRYRSVWERSSHWLLQSALASEPGARVLALWNGAGGDAPGGTSDMVALARERGLVVQVVDL